MRNDRDILNVYLQHANEICNVCKLRTNTDDNEKYREIIALVDLVKCTRDEDTTIKTNAALCDFLRTLPQRTETNLFRELDAKISDINRKQTTEKSKTLEIQSEKKVFINNKIKEHARSLTGSELYHLYLMFLHKYNNSALKQLYEKEFSEISISFDELPTIIDDDDNENSHSNIKRFSNHPSIKAFSSEKNASVSSSQYLDAYNQVTIPFMGRDKEFKELENFAKDKQISSIWAIEAPSGAGKTRLACHWLLNSGEMKNWDQYFLFNDDNDPNFWKTWKPERSTVIIIDGIYLYQESVKSIIHNLYSLQISDSSFKLRLLLIDHIFPKQLNNLKNYEHLSFNDFNDSTVDCYSALFYKNIPLPLVLNNKEQDELINKLIRVSAGDAADFNLVSQAYDKLKQVNGGWHPLFALLIGSTLKKSQDILSWSRHDLIKHYLSCDKRLPSLSGKKEDIYVAASIAAATANGQISLDDLERIIPVDCDIDHVFERCQNITTSSYDYEITAFKPDILGETFFLSFIQNIQNKRQTKRVIFDDFVRMLEIGIQSSLKGAEFISFIQRVAQNLSYDIQSEDYTIKLWKTLFAFLDPDNFTQNSKMHNLASIAISNIIIHAFKSKLPIEVINHIIGLVKLDALYSTTDNNLLEKSMLNAMLYYQHFLPKQSHDTYHSVNLIQLMKYYDLNIENNSGKTALMQAALYRYERVIDLLLSQEWVDEEYVQKIEHEEGFTAFLYAIVNGCGIETIKILHDKGADIQHKCRQGLTPLMLTSYGQNLEVANYLLTNHSDIDSYDDVQGYHALHFMAAFNQIELFKLIVKKENIDHNIKSQKEITPFGVAVMHKHHDFVNEMLPMKPSINAPDKDGRTPLSYAVDNNDTLLIETLMKAGAKIDYVNNMGENILIGEILNDNRDHVISLLDNRSTNIDQYDKSLRPPLIYAAITGFYEIFEKLISEEVHINFADIEGRTALSWTCINGLKEATLKLIELEADLDFPDNKGITPFMHACINGHSNIVKNTIHKVKNIYQEDDNDFNAIIYAISSQNVEILKILAKNSIDMNYRSPGGCTPLIFASIYGYTEMVQYLLSFLGIEINKTGTHGLSALSAAIIAKKEECVELLLEKNADIYQKDEQGRTSLDIAEALGTTEILSIVKKYSESIV